MGLAFFPSASAENNMSSTVINFGRDFFIKTSSQMGLLLTEWNQKKLCLTQSCRERRENKMTVQKFLYWSNCSLRRAAAGLTADFRYLFLYF
jgi:hypothetical protein